MSTDIVVTKFLFSRIEALCYNIMSLSRSTEQNCVNYCTICLPPGQPLPASCPDAVGEKGSAGVDDVLEVLRDSEHS